MNRRVLLALAVAAMAFSAEAAFAGGRNSQYVRVKNIGTDPVTVYAFNEFPTALPPYRTLSQNGVTQFTLKKGYGGLLVSTPALIQPALLGYNFPSSTYVYLQAQIVAGVPAASFAPPGTRF